MNKTIKSGSLAIGVALAGTFALSQSAFAMSDLDQGYMQSADNSRLASFVGEGKAAEGKCGEGEGKCGEGKCGGEGQGTHEHAADAQIIEGKCGEGKCGEGKCGGEGQGEHVNPEMEEQQG